LREASAISNRNPLAQKVTGLALADAQQGRYLGQSDDIAFLQ